MSNDDRSRRVWRLLERGWTSARALKDAIEQVRERVDEARVRLSDEVVSRIAGQPIRTQPGDPLPSDPVRNGTHSPQRASPEAQDELTRAADAVEDDKVVAEAMNAAPPVPTDPIVLAAGPDGRSPMAGALPPVPDLPVAFTTPPAKPGSSTGEPPSGRTPWADLVEPDAQDGDAPSSGGAGGPGSGQGSQSDGLPVEDGEIVVLARDAEWLFVYWDLDAAGLVRGAGVEGDLQFLLKIVQPSGSGLVHKSTAAVPSGRRYVRVPFADASYRAELWARNSDRELIVARSAPAATPPSLPKPAGMAAMVSSVSYRGVLNSAWDLTQVPRLPPRPKPVPMEMPVAESAASADAVPPAEPPVVVEWEATVEIETTTWSVQEGSESRLGVESRRRLKPGPGGPKGEAEGDRAPTDEGSEARLADQEGSEARLADQGGSEARLADQGGSEHRLAEDLGSESRFSPPKGDL